MFDLITGSTQRPLRERAPGSKAVSVVLHIVVLTLILGIPLLTATNVLPQVPTMMAFVTAAPAAPPPPPPPPPPARAAGAARPTPPAPKNPETAAPIEAPADVKAEASTGTASTGGSAVGGVEGGVVGGVEGGVVGGVVGGVLGGIVASVPPPPPPQAPRGPVRVGGQIKTPDLTHRVEPVYPDLAAAAHITGIVILEATVGTDGCVQSVKLLRSAHSLLDKAAVEALKQWQYSPLVLNGIPTPFLLTVTFTFSAAR